MLCPGRIILTCLLVVVMAGCSSEKTTVERSFWPDGSTREEWREKVTADGKAVKHGAYRSWNEDGQLVEEGQFMMSQRSGRWITWYGTEPNAKRREGGYLQGEMDGIWYIWMPPSHDSHGMRSHGMDSSDDSSFAEYADSTQTAEHSDSIQAVEPGRERKPNKREEYRSGQAHGSFVSWYPNGQTADSMGYADGRLEGKYVMYHENGRIATEAVYSKGARQGSQSYWDEEGNLLRTVE